MQNIKFRNGFTMIELIFVIVILGILAVVIIPKLAATRDDARNSVFIANVGTCINDIATSYLATENNITVASIASFDSCSKANAYKASTIEVNSTSAITVSNVSAKFDGVYTFGKTN